VHVYLLEGQEEKGIAHQDMGGEIERKKCKLLIKARQKGLLHPKQSQIPYS
jgi:hypothetical protein